MRYAIVSDIHSNFEALQAVLRRIVSEAADTLVCLGDTVGYGASPNECCEAIRAFDPVIVMGNHDRAAVTPGEERWFTPSAKACIRWTREQISEGNREFLKGLDCFAEIPGAHLCHGALTDPDFYTTTPRDAALTFEQMTHPLCFIGHTHYAEWYTDDGSGHLPVHHPMRDGGILSMAAHKRYIVNPGAVGQPRDGNSQASYAIWDTVEGTIALERVAYNIAAAQQRMRDAGLPRNMSERLLIGV